MREQVIEVANTLQSAYDEQYSNDMTAWRELGGKYKALNIISVCKDKRFKKVLECGAGEGSILKHLDAFGVFPDLYAIEISDSGLAKIKERNLGSLIETKKFDGYHIPYPDKMFEMVYCSHVIEHVEHPRLLLREIKRISEHQVFEVPLDYSFCVDCKVDHFLSYGHINVYTPSLFKFLLKSEGFRVISEKYTHIQNDVVRFNLYNNMGLDKSFLREMKIRMRAVRNLIKRVRFGKNGYRDLGFSAYTCLAKGEGDLDVF